MPQNEMLAEKQSCQKKRCFMMSQAINEEQKERSLHALNPMVLLALIVFLCFLASYIVPAGEYAGSLIP